MDNAARRALATLFADALKLADDAAPAVEAGVDGATAGAIGMALSRQLRLLIEEIEHVPTGAGIPAEVLDRLKGLARIVRAAQDCVAYGDMAIHLARSDMRTIAQAGWVALNRARPEYEGLLAWAGDAPPTAATEATAPTAEPAAAATAEPLRSLLRVFTGGLIDDRLATAQAILEDSGLTVNDKLVKINRVLPIPPTATAEQLGGLLSVSATAVKTSAWWAEHRKGNRAKAGDERRERMSERSQRYEAPGGAD